MKRKIKKANSPAREVNKLAILLLSCVIGCVAITLLPVLSIPLVALLISTQLCVAFYPVSPPPPALSENDVRSLANDISLLYQSQQGVEQSIVELTEMQSKLQQALMRIVEKT